MRIAKSKFRVVDCNRSHSKALGTDYGKIIALSRAGWKIKDIAGDMNIEESEVVDTIRKFVRGEISLQEAEVI